MRIVFTRIWHGKVDMNQLKTILLWVALMIIVSACVAIVTTVVVNDSLKQYAQDLQDTYELIRISQERPKPVPGTYEEALSYVKEQAGDIALITLSNDVVGNPDVERIGAVITSDGWILVVGGSGVNVDRELGQAIIDGDVYLIDEHIVGPTFDLMHASGAQALTPFVFGSSDETREGEWVFGFGVGTDVYVTTLVNGQYVQSSPQLSGPVAPDYEQVAFWLMSDHWPLALFVNASGELIALAGAQGDELVYPIHYGLPWVQSLIKGEEYVMPRLGVTTEWLDVRFTNPSNITSGAYVTIVHDPESIFERYDVITRIDNNVIDTRTPIAEILLDYDVGDMVTVTFVRDGETQEADVELVGSDLVY